MKSGRKRTMSICLTDIDKSRILVHQNGKKYLALETWDYEKPDQWDNDFSVAQSFTKEEIEAKKSGQEVKRNYVGNGRIWEQIDQTRPITDKEIEEDDDLPF